MTRLTPSAFWQSSAASYQKYYRVVNEDDQPPVPFPLVLSPDSTSIDQVLHAASELGAKPSDGDSPSTLRGILDSNGGAINFKNMPLRSAQDFSAFVSALAGKGPHAWVPHKDFGMQLLRRRHAEHVVTTNEGPPSHIIRWHNEYGVSPSHPAYVVFFCVKAPEGGGETPITSSLGVFDRLRRECPELLHQTKGKGYSYTIHHTPEEVGGIVGGNGVFKPTAFGPVDGTSAETLSLEEQRQGVERRIRDLAEMGGWRTEHLHSAELPVWQRRGFDWEWTADGGIDITHRVPGLRIHPTRQIGSWFNALGSRYANANKYNSWEPPHHVRKEDGTEQVVLPPLFAGLKGDEPVPKEWMDFADDIQTRLSSEVSWEPGDVLVIDNYAVQHARWPWTGDRLILASFWDQPGLSAAPMK